MAKIFNKTLNNSNDYGIYYKKSRGEKFKIKLGLEKFVRTAFYPIGTGAFIKSGDKKPGKLDYLMSTAAGAVIGGCYGVINQDPIFMYPQETLTSGWVIGGATYLGLIGLLKEGSKVNRNLKSIYRGVYTGTAIGLLIDILKPPLAGPDWSSQTCDSINFIILWSVIGGVIGTTSAGIRAGIRKVVRIIKKR